MENVNGFIQVYNLWANGRDIDNLDMEFPIFPNDGGDYHNWHTDLKKAVKDFFGVKIKDSDSENGFYTLTYKDYHVTLFSIDVNIKEFEEMFDVKFDFENDDIQELISNYVNYDFNTVAERISKFKK